MVKPGYKMTEVGVIPEDWEVTQIGDLKPFVTSGSRGWGVSIILCNRFFYCGIHQEPARALRVGRPKRSRAARAVTAPVSRETSLQT